MSMAKTAKRVLFHSGLLALARQLRRRERAVILRYHAITDGADVSYAAPDICLPVQALRLQMAFVKRAYRAVPFEEIVQALRTGGPLPPASPPSACSSGRRIRKRSENRSCASASREAVPAASASRISIICLG